MLSPRRTAQLCLGAATLTLVTTFTVLIAGSVDTSANSTNAATPPNIPTAQVTPLATDQLSGQLSGQLGSLQTVATAKR